MKKNLAIIFLFMGCLLISSFMSSQKAEAATVKLSATKKTLYTGESFSLTLKNAKTTVKWKSSNTDVVKVDSNGKIKAVGSGTAKVTAKYKSATYTCKVTVKMPHINCKSAELYLDGTLQLKAYGTEIVKYSSSNEEVATVSSTGLVTAIEEGKTAISALSSDGKTYKCQISVERTDERSVPVNDLTYLNKSGNGPYANDGYCAHNYPYINSSDYLKDNLGNTHEDVFSMDTADITYKIDEKYSYISGTLYVIFEKRTFIGTEYITIYGDDVILWEGSIAAGVEPINFKVSVNGVDKLRIKGSIAYGAIGEFRLTP